MPITGAQRPGSNRRAAFPQPEGLTDHSPELRPAADDLGPFIQRIHCTLKGRHKNGAYPGYKIRLKEVRS